MNNFLLKTQGLGLFPATSWPPILGDQKITSNYRESSCFRILKKIKQEKAY